MCIRDSCRLCSISSSGTSISLTTSSSSKSSTSPAKQVAYSRIDVKTVSAVPGSLSYDKGRALYTIASVQGCLRSCP